MIQSISNFHKKRKKEKKDTLWHMPLRQDSSLKKSNAKVRRSNFELVIKKKIIDFLILDHDISVVFDMWKAWFVTSLLVCQENEFYFIFGFNLDYQLENEFQSSWYIFQYIKHTGM